MWGSWKQQYKQRLTGTAWGVLGALVVERASGLVGEDGGGTEKDGANREEDGSRGHHGWILLLVRELYSLSNQESRGGEIKGVEKRRLGCLDGTGVRMANQGRRFGRIASIDRSMFVWASFESRVAFLDDERVGFPRSPVRFDSVRLLTTWLTVKRETGREGKKRGFEDGTAFFFVDVCTLSYGK